MATQSQINLDWGFHEKQEQVLQALEQDYDLVVFRTGYGGGKSVLGARWIIEKSLEYPRSDNLVLERDTKKGKTSAYKVLFQELPPEDAHTNPYKGGNPENSNIIKDYNATDLRLTTVTDSLIQLGGADKADRYAGGEFHTIWADETARYGTTDLYDLYNMLISRQRTEGLNKMLWTSTGKGYNQFFDITEKEVNPQGEELNWKDSMKVIVGSSKDNPWHEEIEKLERTFGGTNREEQAIKGGFAKPEGLVYSKFMRDTHVVDSSNYEFDRYIYGYDHGWDDPRVVLQIGITPDDRQIVVDEFYREESKIDDAINWLVDNDKPKGFMGCEHMPSHIKDIKNAGWRAKKAEKDLDEGISYVKGRLEIKNEKPGLMVDENCRNTIQEFLGYEEDHVGKSGARDHALDSLRYALYTHSIKGGEIPIASV